MQVTLRKLAMLGSLLAMTMAAQADVIKGRVVDAHNRPVAHADILVESFGPKPVKGGFLTLRTDVAGRFETDLQPGYAGGYGRLYAVAPGLAPDSVFLNTDNAQKENVLRLQPDGTVNGRVVNGAGKALAGVKVQLRYVRYKSAFQGVFLAQTPWGKRFQTVTDVKGHWLLHGVPQGAVAEVIISDPRFVSTNFQASSNATPPVIPIRAGATLTGRVVDEAGKPAANIKVMAQGQGANEGWGDATTAADGTYHLTGLSNGAYNVMVFLEDKSQVAKAIEGQTAREGQTTKLRQIEEKNK